MSTLKGQLFVLGCDATSRMEPGFYLDVDACIYIGQTGQVCVGAQDHETAAAMQRVIADPEKQRLWRDNSDFYPLGRFDASDDPELVAWREALEQLAGNERSQNESELGGVECNEVTLASD